MIAVLNNQLPGAANPPTLSAFQYPQRSFGDKIPKLPIPDESSAAHMGENEQPEFQE